MWWLRQKHSVTIVAAIAAVYHTPATEALLDVRSTMRLRRRMAVSSSSRSHTTSCQRGACGANRSVKNRTRLASRRGAIGVLRHCHANAPPAKRVRLGTKLWSAQPSPATMLRAYDCTYRTKRAAHTTWTPKSRLDSFNAAPGNGDVAPLVPLAGPRVVHTSRIVSHELTS